MFLSKTCFCVLLCSLVFVAVNGVHEQPQQKDELDVYPVLEEIQEDPGNEPSDVQQADDEPELNATSMADEFQNYADSLEQDATAHGKIRQCRYRMVKKRVCQHAGRVRYRKRVRVCRMKTCVRRRGCRKYRYKCRKCNYRYVYKYRTEYRWN